MIGNTWARAGAAAVLGAVLAVGALPSQSAADGRLTYVEKFTDGDNELDVATYYDPTADAGSRKVALIGLRNGQKRNSVAFSTQDWTQMVTLTQGAATAQGSTWRHVGDFQETGTKDPSHLSLDGGPKITFAVSSPALGGFSYQMNYADLPRFTSAVARVTTSLANQTGD